MPMIEWLCPNQHHHECYLPSFAAVFTEPSGWCICGHPLIAQPSWGTPLLYFRENRARYIENLGATIRSHGEHVRVMKARGVEPATDWHTSQKRSRL